MNDQLIEEFDQGLNQIRATDNIYTEYNNLINEINNNTEIKELQDRQKELQFLILNFEQMNKPNFINIYIKELNEIDRKLMTNQLLNRQNKLKMIIDLDHQIIKSELEKLKME